MDKSSISVVVPAYNCEDTIVSVITSLLNQTLQASEIIIVDDGSTDKTAKLIKSFSDVRYVYQNNAGPSVARNKGSFLSSGEYIFFTDSDCLAQRDWLEKAMVCFEKNNVGVVAGSYGIMNNDVLLAKCIHEEIIFRHKHFMPVNPKSFGSYNFGIRRSLFMEMEGFDESYFCASGEDNDLSYRVVNTGKEIFFSREVLVDHYHTNVLKKYLREQYRHGIWRAKMYRDHPYMMKGDGYTFWKDIVEVPVAGFIVTFFLLGVFNVFFVYVGLCLGVCLGALQLYFSFRIFLSNGTFVKFQKEFLYYSMVMFLRSFVRLFGFIFGVLLNLKKK